MVIRERGDSSVTTKKNPLDALPPLRQLKDQIENLESVERLSQKLKEEMPSAFIATHPSSRRFVKNHQPNARRAAESSLLELHRALLEINEHQFFSDSLRAHAYYLSLLEAAQLTKDWKSARKIIKTLLHEPDLRHADLVMKLRQSTAALDRLGTSYNTLAQTMPKESLESALSKVESVPYYTRVIGSVVEEQKQILANLGKHFSSRVRSLVAEKECRDFLEGGGLF